MKRLGLSVGLAALALFAHGAFREDPAKYWNLAELEKVPAARPCPEPESAYPGMEALYLTGKGPENATAEFFCYFALPEGPKPAAGHPAILMVHGGGGTAFPTYVDLWRRAGFAVLAVDWYNSRPAPGLAPKTEPLTDGNLPRKALPGGHRSDHVANVANMVLAHSYLRSRPEVDPSRTVFVGLSWGSWFGAVVSAVDPRFRGAVEIYCGDAVPSKKALVNGRFLHAAKIPMHWFVSTNDANVSPDSLGLGWRECANLDGVTIVNDLPHSHCGFEFPGCIRQAKAYVGLDLPFPKLGAPVLDGRGRLTARLLSAGKGVRRALLCYTRSHDIDTRQRPWEELAAEVQDHYVIGRLPPGVVQCYLSVEDEDDPVYMSCRASTPFVNVPHVPAFYDARDFGAKGDGVTKDTRALQAAVDAAARAGGGEVRLPPGRYLTGSIFLKSGVDFNIGAGAVVEASRDPADYNAWDVCPQNWKDNVENTSGGHLFLAIEQTNVVLRGAGRIEGNGIYFMTNGYDIARAPKTKNALGGVDIQAAIKWRPGTLVYVVESVDVRLEGLEVRDAPYWSVFLHGCEHVLARGLKIHTSRKPYIHNGDGLSLDCCRWVRVADCEIVTSDDSLCLRANGRRLRRSPAETAYVTVENCLLSSRQEAVRIGVGDGRIHDCVFSNLVLTDCDRGINFSSTWFPSHGVDFANIRFDNLTVDCRSSFLRIHRLRSTEPEIREIHLSNVSGRQGEPSFIWSRRGKPFENISLTNVNLPLGVEAVNVKGFRLDGGTLRELKLSPAEYEKRCTEIETFKRLLL